MKRKYLNLASAILDAIKEKQKGFFAITFESFVNYDKGELFREGITIDTEKRKISLCECGGIIETFNFEEVKPCFKE